MPNPSFHKHMFPDDFIGVSLDDYEQQYLKYLLALQRGTGSIPIDIPMSFLDWYLTIILPTYTLTIQTILNTNSMLPISDEYSSICSLPNMITDYRYVHPEIKTPMLLKDINFDNWFYVDEAFHCRIHPLNRLTSLLFTRQTLSFFQKQDFTFKQAFFTVALDLYEHIMKRQMCALQSAAPPPLPDRFRSTRISIFEGFTTILHGGINAMWLWCPPPVEIALHVHRIYSRARYYKHAISPSALQLIALQTKPFGSKLPTLSGNGVSIYQTLERADGEEGKFCIPEVDLDAFYAPNEYEEDAYRYDSWDRAQHYIPPPKPPKERRAVHYIATTYDDVEAARKHLGFEYPFTSEEKVFVGAKGSALAIGRAGCGKTSCLTAKLTADSAMCLRSIFLTVSPHLAGEVYRSTGGTNYKQYCGGLPESMSDMTDVHFPLFLSLDQLVALVDRGCSHPVLDIDKAHGWGEGRFKPPTLTFNRQSPSSMRVFQSPEITFHRCSYDSFLEAWPQLKQAAISSVDTVQGVIRLPCSLEGPSSLYPKSSGVSSCEYEFSDASNAIKQLTTLSPDYIWSEYTSRIRGSFEACERECISLVDYLKGRSPLSDSTRTLCWVIGVLWSLKKVSMGLFEQLDAVRIITKYVTPFPIDRLYFDEAQDIPQAIMFLLFKLCPRMTDSFVMVADSAQTISRGINFKFSHLRTSFWKAARKFTNSVCDPPPVTHLSINFRCSKGVLRLANTLIQTLTMWFPDTIDVLGPEKPGKKDEGAAPSLVRLDTSSADILVCGGDDSAASSVAAAAKVEFGAHQAIITRSSISSESLLPFENALTLTVKESKGLEFDDVFLLRFFADSPLSGDDWNPKTTRFPSKLCEEIKHLYVAVTRTRSRLVLLEPPGKVNPFLKLLLKKKLVTAAQFNAEALSSHNTCEEWALQARNYIERSLYRFAVSAARFADDPRLLSEATAMLLASDGHHEAAAAAFEEAGSMLEAARCWWSAESWVNSARCFQRVEQWGPAVDALEKACMWQEACNVALSHRMYIQCYGLCIRAIRSGSNVLNVTAALLGRSSDREVDDDLDLESSSTSTSTTVSVIDEVLLSDRQSVVIEAYHKLGVIQWGGDDVDGSVFADISVDSQPNVINAFISSFLGHIPSLTCAVNYLTPDGYPLPAIILALSANTGDPHPLRIVPAALRHKVTESVDIESPDLVQYLKDAQTFAIHGRIVSSHVMSALNMLVNEIPPNSSLTITKDCVTTVQTLRTRVLAIALQALVSAARHPSLKSVSINRNVLNPTALMDFITDMSTVGASHCCELTPNQYGYLTPSVYWRAWTAVWALTLSSLSSASLHLQGDIVSRLIERETDGETYFTDPMKVFSARSSVSHMEYRPDHQMACLAAGITLGVDMTDEQASLLDACNHFRDGYIKSPELPGVVWDIAFAVHCKLAHVRLGAEMRSSISSMLSSLSKKSLRCPSIHAFWHNPTAWLSTPRTPKPPAMPAFSIHTVFTCPLPHQLSAAIRLGPKHPLLPWLLLTKPTREEMEPALAPLLVVAEDPEAVRQRELEARAIKVRKAKRMSFVENKLMQEHRSKQRARGIKTKKQREAEAARAQLKADRRAKRKMLKAKEKQEQDRRRRDAKMQKRKKHK
eukprot:gnl/Dysnectes_brevis/2295_a2701_1266.p1 GENE.gnl/Dysnectes_brevis/2295_a2701_1266~~gnl/Dysnectes_brevis/2295_a2701_1266.p1  ORF type:complete len:1629 (+),score=251.39 gnl/Dysnectes_brevis/2295_a2701_1266:44-4930(+)